MNELGRRREEGDLEAAVDVFHGDELFGLFVAHEPGHAEIAGSYILHQLVLFHFYVLIEEAEAEDA